MHRAYLFALDPTPAQAEALRSHCGAARFAYNWRLVRIQANWAQRAAEESYGIPKSERTPWVRTSFYDLRMAWNSAKADVAPWWRENSKEAYASGCANFATALANRKAGRARMPRFKAKHRARLSCRFTGDAFRLGPDRRHVRLARIGFVRTHESTRKLARRVEAGSARILSANVSWQRGRWHVSFTVEVPERERVPRGSGTVGVDLGIKSLAVLSTGEVIDNPRRLETALGELRVLQRAMARRRAPDRRRRDVAPSRRWREAKRRLTRLHTRVANHRRDGVHKLTTRLADQFGTIVIEDLHLAGMVRNKRLARHVAGLGMGEFRRQLQYKAEGRVLVADRFYPSSKTCSACGAVRAKLTLAERVFECHECGTRIDRDYNAALNLAALADQVVLGELRPDVKETVGNARKPSMAGNAYCRGTAGDSGRQTPVARPEPTPHREVTARSARRIAHNRTVDTAERPGGGDVSDLEALARRIAEDAHAGQVDKLGEPYIGHVSRVAGRLKDPLDRAVAWLHDVIEDTDWTGVRLIHLRPDSAPWETVVIDVVRLSHRKGEPRYYARVRESERAVRVKLADIADNTGPDRMARLDETTRDRLVQKYRKAREALGAEVQA